MSADIILYALVAGGLVYWLKSILGERHGEENDRPNPFTNIKEETEKRAAPSSPHGNVVDNVTPVEEVGPSLEKHMKIERTAEKGLDAIAKIDRNFAADKFMKAAQNAFTIIIESFGEGDRDTLKHLLSPNVFKAFEKAITQREKQNQTAEVEVQAIREMDMLDAWTESKMGFIKVRFVADETNVLKDEDGKILEGSANRASETVDVWTFGRDLRSNNPAWLVYETRDDDAADSDHKTVPDTKKKK